MIAVVVDRVNVVVVKTAARRRASC